MICPVCNNEMVPGYIQSRNLIIWSRKKRNIMVFADRDDDVYVGDGNMLAIHKESFRCLQCGTIIIPND